MCENKAALTWPSACPIFASTELTVEALTDLLQKRRFPTLGSRSTENSDADLSESKCVFSSLISQLTSWLVVGDVSPVLFCRLVEGVVRGNMALFEEDAFKSLLRAVLGVAADASSSSVELRQASAAAIACLLYLHSVDYKAALGARQRPLLHTTKHSDLLLSGGDRQLAEETLDCLIKLLEDANVDDPITELSCVHALMQLLCHRKFRVVGSRDHQPILERLRVVKVTTALWVSVCSVRKPQPPPAGRQADNAPYFSSSGFSSSGETSDVGGGDCGPPDPDAGAGSRVSQNQKKTRLLATFCLRHLLATSKKICQEVWPILMPEPAVPSSPSARAGKRAFQPDLVTIILKEGDYKLREIFIIMLWTLLNSMDKRFSVAEELSTWQSASFIPYSVKLAAELRSLHRRLAWALLSEKSHRHQLALLKVINALVTTTPYHRLRPGLLSDLVPTLNTVFFRPSDEPSKTALVKASILNIWSTILSKPTILEIHQLLIAKPSKSMSSSKVFEHWKDSKPDAPADVVSGVGPLNNILSRRFADSFSTCWLVELCLRLIHPKVADLAWDAGTADSNGPAAASPREAPQPNALRVQAISTLRAFVAVYYDCLRPSMHLLKRTIHLCLQPDMEENKPLRTDVFRLCDALISKVFESLITDLHSRLPAPQGVELSSKGDDVKLSSDCDSSLKTNVAWWTDIIAVILDNTTANTEGSECWWACQVIESFFELQSILSTDDSLADLCVRAISLFTDLCRERRDGVEAKALRKLCSLAILESPFIHPDFLSQTVNSLMLMLGSVTSSVACEMAYCLEVCTLKLITQPGSHQLNCAIQGVLKTCLELCSSIFPDAESKTLHAEEHGPEESWTGLDGRRCEHAIHALANTVEIAFSRPVPTTPIDLFVEIIAVFSSSLKISNVSGAEKIRWNAALASGRLLRIQNLITLCLPETQGYEIGDHVIGPLVTSLCRAFVGDFYLKVRTHAALSLLLLFKNTLDASLNESVLHPSHQMPSTSNQIVTLVFTEPILKSSLSFLSTDPNRLRESGSGEAYHYVVVCFFTAVLLLLHCAIFSLLSLQSNDDSLAGVARRNLQVISAGLDNATLRENLASAFHYAKESPLAAFSVTRGSKAKIFSTSRIHGLARLVDQPMKISFSERYALIDRFDFNNSLSALLRALKLFETLVAAHQSDVTAELRNLPGLLTNGVPLEHAVKTYSVDLEISAAQQPPNDLLPGSFRTTYD